MKAVNNYLVVELLEKKPGLSIITNSFQHLQGWAKVLNVGPGHPDIAGSKTVLPVFEGDIIYCARHGLVPHEDVYFISEFDIITKKENDTVVPIGNRIQVEVEPEKTTSKTGLIRASSDKPRQTVGTVITLGTGWRDMNQNLVPFHVEVGDKVIFVPNALVPVDGKDADLPLLHFVDHGNILGKL